MARSAVIAPLTGVRLVAAAWVVLFHIYLYNGDDLAAAHPLVDAVVGPVVSQGDLGVDLFFLLSGFVLAHNYLDRIGARPSLPDTASFLWLRVARIWPLYMVVVLTAGLLLALRQWWWGSTPNVSLSGHQLVEQMAMVQQWGAGNVPNTSWAGPAWSISAEWLAYLCFPLLAVVVWRLRRYAGPGITLALAAVVLVPTLVWTAAAHTQAAPYMWLARLASEFVCGMLLSAAVARGSARSGTAAGWLAPVAVSAGVTWLYLADLLDRPWLGPLVLAVFPVLVLALARGDGAIQRCLGSRPMVLGGGMSFALYLVHVPLLKLFRDALGHHALPMSPRHQLGGELAIALSCLALAYLLFKHVEETARRRLRSVSPEVVAAVVTALSPERAAQRFRALARRRTTLPERIVRKPVVVDHGVELQLRQLLY